MKQYIVYILVFLMLNGLLCMASISLSNEGRIVFVRKNNGIWVIDADGKNEKQLTTGRDWNPAWSSDGKQIAFSRDTDSDRCIYIMNADESDVKQLTNGPNDDFPTWSPDGKQIAFTKAVWEQKGGKWEIKSGGIYVIDSDGANLKKLIESTVCFEHPDWSPDGRKIAYHLLFLDAPNQVWVTDADGGNQKMLYRWGQNPTWSSDGSKIAFGSEQAGTYDIYVVDADGANVKILPSPSTEDQPRWSPDGTKIAFVSNRDGNWEIYVMDTDGQNIQRITNTPEIELEPDWTAFSYAVEPAGKLMTTWGKIKRELYLESRTND